MNLPNSDCVFLGVPIVVKQVLSRHPAGQGAENVFDGDAESANGRFSDHDMRIHCDAV